MADWQSLDPEAAREAEKYDNPIPSRELILQRLADRGEPAAREAFTAFMEKRRPDFSAS